MDPARDTPERLATYAGKFDARRGWYFLTGDPDNVDLANYRLGQYVGDPEAHRNVILVGNESTALWKKAPAILGVDKLHRLVIDVLEDR